MLQTGGINIKIDMNNIVVLFLLAIALSIADIASRIGRFTRNLIHGRR